ncbi:bifunctional glycosyl transferase/transpeptidase [Pantoea sp. Nvir]|uniref:bifunctional glycosyl transferase/transpeptidase n=1 Tax=Pantoea sp. Nvir TaxID=2576760 RepID=UPI0027EE1941|nr:bifunctional glycosyl transferase/transpeptidase [Pantoea sp. Nvir]CAJ0991333.1 Penicillin-binding protein 1B [Pantoea sp. Nvir]
MSGNDREPIGRRKQPKSTNNAKRQSRYKDKDDYNNDIFLKDINEMASVPHKSKIKWLPRGKNHWLGWFIKFFFVFIVVTATWGVYLDSEIRTRIDGKVWQLPAAVYGRIVSLEPGMPYSKKEMIALLKGTQYRQVSRIAGPGEFSIKGKTISLLRRPFFFPDGRESQVHVQMVFNGNELSKIKNLDSGRDFGFFILDPRLITMLQSPNGEQRLFVPRSEFPDLLIDTLIATEDRHFYEHDGISPYSIGRALLANITAGKAVQGGSTLTQQLVKNLFLTNERSLWRKVREVFMAVIMDMRYSKDRILELYLNEVYFGQAGNDQIRGFPLASLYYFGRPVEEPSLDQQAMLVGMVKGASLYNPWHHPKLALTRRNLVLKLLQQQKVIDQELYNVLSVRPLGVQPKDGVITPQPAFMQMVRSELQTKLGNKVKNLSGVRIFTTLDPISQDAAEKAVINGIVTLKRQRGLKDLETAMVVVDRFSGEVRAIVGGADPQFAGYNRALQACRSIGSLAKPATYLTALSQPNNYRLNSWIADEPIMLKQPNGTIWKPMNDDRHFSGKVMLVDAFTNSLNVPTVNLGMILGLDSVVDTWTKLGVPKEQLNPVPSMLLGALNLTPIEVAQTFQSIANGGNRAPLSVVRSVIGEDGTLIYQSYPQAQRVASAQASYLTLYTMQQVADHGTAYTLGKRYPKAHLAGKTGTTNNLVDSWFAGIDGKEVAITWVGRDNNQPSELYGVSGAMQIYRRYLDNQAPTPLVLTPPEDVTMMNINSAGNFVCGNGSGISSETWRSLPVWSLDPNSLCQQ